MATKVPEKIFMNKLLDTLDKQRNQWTTKDTDNGKALDISTHNTALVIKALREAAHEAGYISLMFVLQTCKIDED